MNEFLNNLKKLSNKELHEKTFDAAQKEKQSTLELLYHLHEVSTRRLFAERGFSSLFEYVVKYLNYSESQAFERINAMRLIFSNSEIKEVIHDKIQNGEMNLTVASKIQSFVRKIEKEENIKLSGFEKLEIIKETENLSSRAVDRFFINKAPALFSFPQEKEKMLSTDATEIKIIADKELMELVERYKELKGNLTYAECFKHVLKEYLKRKDPSQKEKAPSELVLGAPQVTVRQNSSRYIAQEIKNTLYKRSNSQCEFKDPITQKRCEWRHKLEIDHIIPWSAGGENSLENLRILCSTHNKLSAIKFFGRNKMQQYLKF